MKFKIIFYLFIFVCILLFFQLFNTNKVLNYQDDLIQKQNKTNVKLKDSIKFLQDYRDTNVYFSLSVDSEINETQLIDELRSLNTKGGLRKLIPSIPKKNIFLVDQIKVINKKWILIGYKSDSFYGQALIEYLIKNDNSVMFTELSHFVVPL